jgi:Cd2+/Zn2+-exporting ATPase
VFGLADQPRAEAADAVRALRDRAGVRRLVMSTGDSERVAGTLAERTGITECRAGLLPADKLDTVRTLQSDGAVALVGDASTTPPRSPPPTSASPWAPPAATWRWSPPTSP